MTDPTRITQVLQRLIIDMIPSNINEKSLQEYFKYFHRILTSRITSLEHDESSLKTLMTQKVFAIASENNIQKHTANSSALRIQEILQKFGQNRVLNHRVSILYLLLKLANTGKTSKTMGSGAIEALFKAKEEIKRPMKPQSANTTLNKTNISINNNSTTMEIEKAPAATERRSNNESFLLQTIKKVTVKGNEAINLSENDILRDILYVFHAIDGHYINFNDQENSYIIKSGVPLAEPLRNLINSLCEIGYLYRRLSIFLNKPQPGLIRQALALSVKEELNEYFKLLALLENLRLETEESNNQSLSLRKLALWVIEPHERLKWLNIMADGAAELIGGDVLSSLYSYKSQGSPVTLNLLNRIMINVYQPFLKYVCQWIYQGVINDPIGEFFVSEIESETNVWVNKYKINSNKIPSFLEKSIAEKIFLSGKTVNFLKKCCNEKEWVLHIEPFEVKDLSNVTKFQDWVLLCSSIINQKLLEVLFLNFSLEKHLESLKKYLLMGQGDLIQNLMDNLTNELNKPASQIYRHQLMGALETAIRTSNAQYHPTEFVNRLEIKLLEPSPGDTGWDIFTLDYRVESPLNTIFHQNIMRKYLRIFNFLWRVKRVEFCLNNVWINQMKASQYLAKTPGVRKDFHRCHLLRNEMIHFIDNLFNYLMVEVIEATWDQFKEKLGGLKELNELIELHENCIDKILEKALLKEKTDAIYKHLLKIFEFIYRLKFTQDILLNKAQEQYSFYQQRKNELEIEELPGFGQENAEILNSIAKDYMEALFSFQNLLKNEENLGNLRFLSFRLDFNEYYNNQPGNRFSNMSNYFGGKGFLGMNDPNHEQKPQNYDLKTQNNDFKNQTLEVRNPAKESKIENSEILSQFSQNVSQRMLIDKNINFPKPPERTVPNVSQESFDNEKLTKKPSIFDERLRKKPSWLEQPVESTPNPTSNLIKREEKFEKFDYKMMGLGKKELKEEKIENKMVMESIFKHDMEDEGDEFLEEGEDEEDPDENEKNFLEEEEEEEEEEQQEFDPNRTNSFKKK